MLRYIHTSEREFLVKTIMNILKNIKNNLTGSILCGVLIGVCLLSIVIPQATNADFDSTSNASYLVKNTSWVPRTAKTIKVVITAYSSTLDQTDDSPFVTASGKCVKDGTIANNMLPFGTKIMIPALYGDKVFVVEDRMNKRKGNYHFDIWMPSKPLAVNFGVKTAEIEVLEN